MPLTARFFLTLTFVAGCVIAVAAIPAEGDPQAIPALTAHVTDLTGTLDATQKQTLEDQLTALEKSKGSQVGVLLLPTTNPEDIAAYGIRVADAWKLGRKGTDDGVIVIVAKNDHRVRIEVGQGLEGAIPDAAAARIIREYITPRFRANDYFGGLQDATGALGKLINEEPLPPPLTDEPAGGGHGNSGDYGPAFILGWFVALTLRRMLGGIPVVPRTGLVGIGAGLAAWFVSGFIPISIGIGVLGMLFGVLGGGKGGGFASGGGWGGFSGGGGGGWSSGGGGGGFSGGGGGFSGGGASGSW